MPRTASPLRLLALLPLLAATAAAQLGSAFTYQGQLRQAGIATTDTCDFEFRLFDDPNAGLQIGPTLTLDGSPSNGPRVPVVDGLFTVKLDFGAAGVFEGDPRFLQISVRCPGGAGAYQPLRPRQPLCAVPYALYALDSPASFNIPLEVTLPFNGPLFSMTNTEPGGAPVGLRGRVLGGGSAIEGIAEAAGRAATFTVTDADNAASAVFIQHAGAGAGLQSNHPGTGVAGLFTTAATNDSDALVAVAGPETTGRAAHLQLLNPASTAAALEAVTTAVGDALRAITTGSGRAGFFQVNVAAPGDNTAPALEATTNGNGQGVRGIAPNSDGVFGRTNVAGTFILPPGSVVAGVHGEGSLAAATADSFAVAGTAQNSGTGVLGIGEQAGHGVVGVSGNTFQAPPRSVAGVWGMTREDAAGGFTWPPNFSIQGTTGPKELVGVLGQAVNHVGVWGESINNVGVVGTVGPAAGAAVLPLAVRVGVFGFANAPIGANYGVFGTTPAASGRGVLGTATSPLGSATGVSGTSLSATGRGVSGFAFASPGANAGVYGESQSTEGTGVLGFTTKTTGQTFGVRGEAASQSGTGVFGLATRSFGDSIGVIGESRSNEGTGVYGFVSSANTIGERIGVKGELTSGEGIAVQGITPVNSQPTRAIQGINGSNANGVAVEGIMTRESGPGTAIRAETASRNGIAIDALATATTFTGSVPTPRGVRSIVHHPFGIAVEAVAEDLTGFNTGVAATARGTDGVAVSAQAPSATGATFGVKAGASSPQGIGVAASGGAVGLDADGDIGVRASGTTWAVRSEGNLSVTGGAEIDGQTTTGSLDVTGDVDIGGQITSVTSISATNLNVAANVTAAGSVDAAGNLGGASLTVDNLSDLRGNVQVGGNLTVSGTLSKGGGSFRIDHPLDPANRYLSHSFVESPDMLNIYNGNTVTDATGRATVELPEWFEALNRDFRYQLTVIGQFAQAIVAEEIRDGTFVIRTDLPGVRVSWQVTGIRHDPWADANRIPVEEWKLPTDRGSYLHPEALARSLTPDP